MERGKEGSDAAAYRSPRLGGSVEATGKAAMRAASPRFRPEEVATILRAYSSLKIPAPTVYAAASDAVHAWLRGMEAATQAKGPKAGHAYDVGTIAKAGHRGAGKAAEPLILTSQLCASLALSFARSLSAQPLGSGSAATVAPPAHTALPVRAAYSALSSLAPYITALACAARVPLAQMGIIAAEDYTSLVWAYARGFTGPAGDPAAGGMGASGTASCSAGRM